MHHSDAKSRRGNAVARHCEERSDEAIKTVFAVDILDCFALPAMTTWRVGGYPRNAAARKKPRPNDVDQHKTAARLSLPGLSAAY
jgi:hypothetical protein